jgi:thioredoxin 1
MPCRPIVAVSLSILTLTFFASCLSRDSVWKNAHTTNSKGEVEIMRTLQANHKIEHVDASTFNEKVLQSAVPVLVDFYAEWCGPCKALAPVLEDFARENPDAKIFKVNVDENHELANRYRIESIPSLLVFKSSELSARHMGFADKAALKQLVTR